MKKIIFFIFLFISISIIGNFISSIYQLWHKQDVLVHAQKQLELEKQKNVRLKKQAIVVATQEFLEKEARNKLFLIKPGESELIIPQEFLKKSSPDPIKQPQKPNWQQWMDVFFHNF